jgi:hypothetical protein
MNSGSRTSDESNVTAARAAFEAIADAFER